MAQLPFFTLPGMPGDVERIEAALVESVRTPDAYLNDIASHLIVAGGKRLRPVLTLVAAQVADGPASDDAVQGGIACELVQTGSLYHDDVMDEAPTRRGVETVNAKWGNLQAILAGDFLLSRASEIAASLGTEVAALLARTIGRLCEGQIEELRHTYNAARPEQSYLASDRRQDRIAVRDVRPASVASSVGFDRPTIDTLTEYGECVRHGVPDRRRPARHHGHRRGARQAGGPRHGRGRVHAARACARCRRAASRPRRCSTSSVGPLEPSEREKALEIVRTRGRWSRARW